MTDLTAQSQKLLALHADPALLKVVNVWDAITARVVSGVDGIEALATASHSIAAAHGYEDGEHIPVDLMIEAIGTVVAATDLPVTADLEAGYGNPGETARKAMSVGVVGANLEDQMKPLPEAVAAVEAVLAAGHAEGIDFVLNARTDAFVLAGDRPHADVLADAIERGSAYLAAGAPLVFVPGLLTEDDVTAFVDAWGPQKLTVIGVPGSLPLERLEELGVARVSYGPTSQSVALMALQDLTRDIVAGGALPADFRPLN
ncbi:isocitrate lyase/PEP mutase family protein [Aeromicrobium wangtongii]|uniref:Isocitrate lyase/phosphoenolpyruvate mutase family protein n=1 Tax=Aeromicrobium wangtongii TaxID=2969247 RepID=A0ABY5M5N5_9ACTN|nr:isocitrate lyase/phosphoenolpyruvate mutase family protein [Aeromicrobium wangtongii]MCD9199190.1 isocitrate lyase/phosphoenolpyruvate mutase family protein [Aeromicrobium wangtongii]MCL3820125.1 isocitrate lyase/phosphoenolpyruvate mutase family protein [Aeromicrobium wangtongii]UUP12782.1 isocitrate lyase/phosphoenolpyruvate mutase family protein [Aeromicrobium wangtongii]